MLARARAFDKVASASPLTKKERKRCINRLKTINAPFRILDSDIPRVQFADSDALRAEKRRRSELCTASSANRRSHSRLRLYDDATPRSHERKTPFRRVPMRAQVRLATLQTRPESGDGGGADCVWRASE